MCQDHTLLGGQAKWPRETKAYKDLADILVQFTNDMKGGSTSQPEEEKPQTPTDITAAKPEDVALLQNKHMKKGKLHHGMYFQSCTWFV